MAAGPVAAPVRKQRLPGTHLRENAGPIWRGRYEGRGRNGAAGLASNRHAAVIQR